MKKILFAASAVMLAGGAAMAAGQTGAADPCVLIAGMQGIFRTLRTLAFAGAAFFIATWAWGFISKGDVAMEDLKNKGTGLLVGFTLLFGIGMVLQFLPGISGCAGVGW